MRSLRSLALLPVALASIIALQCGGSAVGSGIYQDGGPTDEASVHDGDVPVNPDAVGATTASKVDLLLLVDDSSSMGDKAALLASSIPGLLKRIVVAGDVHLGVITSSLGTFGGNVCSNTGKQNSHAHLVTGVPSAANGVLAFGGGASTDVNAFIADATKLVTSVGETGCGLEAQLESAYHFLVQPDPWQDVTVDQFNQGAFSGVDAELLAQRKAFLRPDSLVVVVMLTDEDDSSPDPLSVGGQGWAFSANQFPGSTVFRADGKTTTAPRATTACQTDPGSPDCTSCGFAATCNPSDAACQKIRNDPECQKNGGYYGPNEDQLNVRYQRMKERYGVDPQYPISRYVDGFTKQKVPSTSDEHDVKIRPDSKGRDIGPYVGTPKCTNPLFAASLPSGPGDDLCNLPLGARGKDLVIFAIIGGVPEKLASASPSWTPILGSDPANFNFDGIDPHMIQSIVPRLGLPGPSSTRGDNGTDPIHGREWDTGGNDLQYACTFALPTSRMCTAQDASCDCADTQNPPLCGPMLGDQIKAKAYPTVRELRVAKELGERGIIGSICPTNTTTGYASTMSTLADRLAPHIK
jgi:hypothetical protein